MDFAITVLGLAVILLLSVWLILYIGIRIRVEYRLYGIKTVMNEIKTARTKASLQLISDLIEKRIKELERVA